MKNVLRPAAETAMVVGLLGWIYVAALAAARPLVLSEPITALVPLRRDTFGALCLAASAACAFALHARTGSFWVKRKSAGGVVDAALRTLIAYALLVWTYLCVNSLTHPYTTGMRLTHFSATPSEGTAAVVCFVAAAVALFLVRARECARV